MRFVNGGGRGEISERLFADERAAESKKSSCFIRPPRLSIFFRQRASRVFYRAPARKARCGCCRECETCATASCIIRTWPKFALGVEFARLKGNREERREAALGEERNSFRVAGSNFILERLGGGGGSYSILKFRLSNRVFKSVSSLKMLSMIRVDSSRLELQALRSKHSGPPAGFRHRTGSEAQASLRAEFRNFAVWRVSKRSWESGNIISKSRVAIR